MKQAEDGEGGHYRALKLKLAQVYISGATKRCTAGVVNGSSSATLSEAEEDVGCHMQRMVTRYRGNGKE